MNNILLVGNGFDLAHGLPTSYNDFLFLMKNWGRFYSEYEDMRRNPNKDPFRTETQISENVVRVENRNEKIDSFLRVVSPMDKALIDKFYTLINGNSWSHYYCNCGAEIDKWIDFEKEIYPVIDLFEIILEKNVLMDNKYYQLAKLFPKYLVTSGTIQLRDEYKIGLLGIKKKTLLDDLRKEFDGFISAFELYLHIFVYKRDDVKLLKQIKELEIGSVISFNYTLTEKLYGIKEDNVHHIHGMIREEIESEKNNMVMGVNEQENQNMDFIYFVKYFQRIQKASGVRYKSFVRSKVKNNSGIVQKEKYDLYIYGHSLDETDEDILKYVIGDKTETGKLKLNPQKVIIFYYDPADFEQKVINLIKLYGRPIVEEYMEKELFEFIPTTGEVWCE